MDLVNRTPVLARSKRLVQRAFSGTFERVRQLREESLDRQISEPPGPLPPSWLADVFGPRGVPCTSERARTRLGWQPLVDRDEGLRVSLEWLEFLDLAPTAPPTAAAAGVEEAEGVHT
jgi:hypothetical protein